MRIRNKERRSPAKGKTASGYSRMKCRQTVEIVKRQLFSWNGGNKDKVINELIDGLM